MPVVLLNPAQLSGVMLHQLVQGGSVGAELIETTRETNSVTGGGQAGLFDEKCDYLIFNCVVDASVGNVLLKLVLAHGHGRVH